MPLHFRSCALVWLQTATFSWGNPLPASIKDFIRYETSVHSGTVVYAWMEVGNSVFIPCLIYLGSTRLNILKEPSRRKEEDPIHFLWRIFVGKLGAYVGRSASGCIGPSPAPVCKRDGRGKSPLLLNPLFMAPLFFWERSVLTCGKASRFH